NVNPMPMRGAFTGFDGPVEVDDPEVSGCFPGCFSGVFSGLFEIGGCFGRLLLGLAVVPEVADFSLGREVRNAPRTSSSCITGAAIPITTAQRQTNPKTMTLNLISNLL